MKTFTIIFLIMFFISLIAILSGATHHVLTLLICIIMSLLCYSEVKKERSKK